MQVKLITPTKLSEIKLKHYQEFLKIASNNDDVNFIQQKIVQIFCGVELRYVDAMQRKDVVSIANSITTLFEQKPKLIRSFKLGSLEFGFIPNLDEMTNGEYIDLDSYVNDWQTMHKAMAVLYRPITKKQKDKYTIEPYVSSITYAEVMEYMPLDVALSSVVFFWSLGNELLNSTMHYLESNKEMQDLVQQHNLANAGDGIQVSMHSLKEMLQDLMKLPNYPYTNA
jgi:hypothetical protein